MTEKAEEPFVYTQSAKVNGRFVNPWKTFLGLPTFGKLFKFIVMDRLTGKDVSGVPSQEVLNVTLPVLSPDPVIHSPPENRMLYTWIGHATGLVQFDGISVLTDPVFSERASPLPFAGPKRYRPVPLNIAELPRIDACVVSHNHYDHLDRPSVLQLTQRFPSMMWYVGLGTRQWMVEQGVPADRVVELDWWQEHSVLHQGRSFTFAFTPAQHWCKRSVTDTNTCLWGSWTVIGPSSKKFFFAGDTGYCEGFAQIGRKYGPIDLATIPIGAYEPREFMKPQHVNPDEAVCIHQDIKSTKSIGVHFGTFKLTFEHYLEPPKLLLKALEERGLLASEFIVIKHGETHQLD